MTILDYIIYEFEGGKLGGPFTDDASDRGGATRFGMTQNTVSAYYGRPVSKQEIRNLPLSTAVEIGTKVFVEQPGYAGILDWRVRLVTVDFGYNFGPDDASPALQRAVGAKPDGQVGPITIHMVNEADPLTVCLKVLAERQFKHVQQSYRPLQLTNIRGWINRTSTLAQRITWKEPLT